MPPRGWRLRIEDILEAIAKIERYAVDLDYESFCEDDKTVDAVCRNLTVIGEAARRVPEGIVQEHPLVPWAEMWDMRNIIVHEYSGVSLEILWQTVREDLPPLAGQLRDLLAAER